MWREEDRSMLQEDGNFFCVSPDDDGGREGGEGEGPVNTEREGPTALCFVCPAPGVRQDTV